MMEMHSNSREDRKIARAGDIVAFGGLKDTITGETLCDEKRQIILEKMDFPEPVIKIAIEPKTKGDLEKMANGLYKLGQEDPSFHYSRDEETNQTVIEGMGELHLDIIVDRLKREFKVECTVGAPQVNYREAITEPAGARRRRSACGPVASALSHCRARLRAVAVFCCAAPQPLSQVRCASRAPGHGGASARARHFDCRRGTQTSSTCTRSSRAAAASSPRSVSSLRRVSLIAASPSSPRSGEASCRRSTSRVSSRASRSA